jgi:predicted small secreted protein
MKNIILSILILSSLIFTSCETTKDVKEDIQKLRTERREKIQEVRMLNDSIYNKKLEISELNEKLKELNIYKSGETPKYILKIRLSQSHLTFDIEQHMKDAMNDVEFEMPVDKDFYNSVKVGTQIVDDFRVGSFILSGSIGSWDMEVISKEIR